MLGWTQGRFGERGIPTPRLDAELLLAHLLGRDRIGLYTHFDQPLEASELTAYRDLIKRRIAGEPVAYLVGKKEFRSLELAVDARVLVPRPDTECVVELALERIDAGGGTSPRVVDVGTGSGAIALAIKAERPASEVCAIDRSVDAAEVARGNATRLGLAVEVLVGDLLAPIAARAPLHLVVSNPPYIPSGELQFLPSEVRREPRLALDGGPDGLALIRRLIDETLPLLSSGGALVLEVGAGQAADVVGLFAAAGYVDVVTRKDLAGIERAVSGQREKAKS